MQVSLFNDGYTDTPATEGIKYIGSKLKVLPYILGLINQVKPKSVLDGFAGTTRVSQALSKLGYRVFCNDIAVWTQIFGNCYLLNYKTREDYEPLIKHLNNVIPFDGWFTQYYGGEPNDGCAIQPDGSKKPWQRHNTRKLDAIRLEIDKLCLEPVDKAVALTSLILGLDKVDSSLGHYVSYLKNWSQRSYGNLYLQVPMVSPASTHHQVFRSDIFDILPTVSVDLAYFDPPYGSNNEKMPPSRVRYASYYHIWKSIILYDKPELFGKSNRRKDTSDTISRSDFEEYKQNEKGRFIALEAIENLIKNTQAKYIILSYSSGGRATAEDLEEVMNNYGKIVKIVEIEYRKNVMADMRWTNQWLNKDKPNHEFLFLLKK